MDRLAFGSQSDPTVADLTQLILDALSFASSRLELVRGNGAEIAPLPPAPAPEAGRWYRRRRRRRQRRQSNKQLSSAVVACYATPALPPAGADQPTTEGSELRGHAKT